MTGVVLLEQRFRTRAVAEVEVAVLAAHAGFDRGVEFRKGALKVGLAQEIMPRLL
jgi:hypothetical protein